MSAVFDILILLIMLGSVFSAVKKGFVKSIIGLAGLVVAIFLAVTLAPKLGAVIDNGMVKPFIRDNIVKTFAKALEGETSNDVKLNKDTGLDQVDIMKLFNDSDMPKFAKDILSSLNISAATARTELSNAVAGPEAQATMGNFVEKLIDKSGISRAISNAIGFFIIFVAVLILAKVAELLAGVITKLPILKQSDKLLGAALGVLNGVILIFILCIVVKALSGFITSPDGTSFNEGILNKTILFKYFYNFNPFTSFKL